LADTLNICFLYLLKISALLAKKISLSKETDFEIEIETLDAWISLNTDPNDMKFLTHIFLYDL